MIVLDGIVGATIERQTEHGKLDGVIVGYFIRNNEVVDPGIESLHFLVASTDGIWPVSWDDIGGASFAISTGASTQWNIVNVERLAK